MVLHIIFSFYTGGSETMLVDILNHQSNHETVKLLIVNDKVNHSLIETLSSDIEVKLIGRKQTSKYNINFIFKIWFFILKNKPRAIHCHNHNLIKILLPWKNRCVLTVHDVSVPKYNLKYYNKVFAISHAVKDDIVHNSNVLPLVINNGVDIHKYFVKDNYVYDNGISFDIIQVSRLMHTKKGQHFAIEALKIIVEKYGIKNITLSFAGSGDSYEELVGLVKKYSLSNYIKFIGEVSRVWVMKNLKDYHLLVQPSLYEGFGLTIVEGLSAGLPVIASNLDGPKEILTNLDVGRLIDCSNVEKFAEEIIYVYNSYINRTLIINKLVINEMSVLNQYDISLTALNYLNQY